MENNKPDIQFGFCFWLLQRSFVLRQIMTSLQNVYGDSDQCGFYCLWFRASKRNYSHKRYAFEYLFHRSEFGMEMTRT